MRAGLDQRRRQMADDDRRRAALGLRRLAGIVDDEGIDQRNRPERDFRRAIRATAPTLLPGSHSSVPCAPQWISASTLLALAQPQIESEKAVARRQRAVVIIGLAIFRRAAIRLQRDDEFAEPQNAKGKGAVAHRSIACPARPSARRASATNSRGKPRRKAR